MISVRTLDLRAAGLEQIRAEAWTEGYKFIETLVEDLASGSGLFGRPGEVLRGCFEGGEMIAVGGLTSDPFVGDGTVGRIRRVYVRASWRNQGVGRLLVGTLVDDARKGFRAVRLRAENADAARLYERMGFVAIDDPQATHEMVFQAR